MRMENKFFALIINVLDGELYLDKCLSSLVNQKSKNFKIYIFDNLSKDSTAEIVRNWLKKYPDFIEYLLLPRFLSINEGRNYALKYLRKNYLDTISHFSFCDSDDYWEPEWISRVSEVCDNNSIVYCDGYEDFGDRKVEVRVNHHTPEYSLFSSRIYFQGSVIPFSFLTDNPFFDQKFMFCIDVDKWNELYYKGVNFIHIDTPLFYYRIHESSLSATGFNRVMKERWHLTKKYNKSRLLYLIKFSYYYLRHIFLGAK